MKIPPSYTGRVRNGSSLKSLLTLALVVISLFCGSFSVSAAPLLGSALASFAVPSKTGVTNVPKNKINGNLSPVNNIFVSEEYASGTVSSVHTLFPSYPTDYNFVGPIVDVGSNFTVPILPATGFESSGSIDQAVNIQSVAAIPEPATLALLGLGFAGFGFARRRHG